MGGGGSGALIAKNSDTTSWHELLYQLHQFSQNCTVFHAVTKRFQMHPNTTKFIQTWVLHPMGWARCVLCEKFWRNFVAHPFAPIAPVQHSLHQVSSSTETIPNAPKHHQTHQNMSLGSNEVHRLLKILTRLHGTNFYINCTSSTKIAPSFVQYPGDPKYTKTLRNPTKHEGQMGWTGCVCCEKFRRNFVAQTSAPIAPV